MSKNADGTYTGYIYLITNLINGKHYVGQTTTTIEHRWGQHKTDYNNPNPMYKAFQKYGLENFRIDEISHYTRDTLDKLLKILNSKEIYYINKYQSLTTQNGYNLSIGGNNRGIYNCFPIDVYNREGELIYECNSAKETSRLLKYDTSSIIDCCNGKSVPNINYIFRYHGDSFNKFSIKRRTTAKRAYQFTLDGNLVKIHESYRDAAKYVNGIQQSISDAISGRLKTYKGYYWNNENKFDFVGIKDVRRKVKQYDTLGNLLHVYDSAINSARAINKRSSTEIISCCKGEIKIAYGFVWRYFEDDFLKYQK